MYYRDFFEVLFDKFQTNIFAFILLSVDMEAKRVKRGRAPNFSTYENSILLDLIDKHKSKIENKNWWNVFKEKENCWKELSVDFNFVPGMSIQNKTLHHIVSPKQSLCPDVWLLHTETYFWESSQTILGSLSHKWACRLLRIEERGATGLGWETCMVLFSHAWPQTRFESPLSEFSHAHFSSSNTNPLITTCLYKVVGEAIKPPIYRHKGISQQGVL